MPRARRKVEARTVVSPDAIDSNTPQVSAPVTAEGGRVVLVPMDEWKQCAQRGVRSAIQAFIFILPIGVASWLRGLGVPDATVINIPSTHDPFIDSVLYALLFGVIVFIWNFIEFWLDIDIKAPKWRA